VRTNERPASSLTLIGSPARSWADASARALATYADAKRRYLAGLPEGETFFVTTVLRDGDGRFEQVFVLVDHIEGGRITIQGTGFPLDRPHVPAVHLGGVPARVLRSLRRRTRRTGDEARQRAAAAAREGAVSGRAGGAPAGATAREGVTPPRRRGLIARVARQVLYTEPALRLLGHMLLVVARRA
jgi:hypothetical protein